MRNGRRAGSGRLGWLIAGVLSTFTAGWGLLDRGIYVGLMAPATRPGALSQDVITVFAGVTLCGLALVGTRVGPKAELVGLGLLGYLFYGYGIYVIERVYNVLYLNYLAIFGIAAWLVVLGAVDVVHYTADRASLTRQFSKISAGGALLPPLIFYPLWISMLIPIMVTREQIDSLYSIFILDLVFIMPAFLLVAVGQFRGRSWAVLLAPVMFILGAVLIFSLALGELVKPGLRIAHHDGRAAAADAAHRAVRGLGGPAPQKAVLQAQRSPANRTRPLVGVVGAGSIRGDGDRVR